MVINCNEFEAFELLAVVVFSDRPHHPRPHPRHLMRASIVSCQVDAPTSPTLEDRRTCACSPLRCLVECPCARERVGGREGERERARGVGEKENAQCVSVYINT